MPGEMEASPIPFGPFRGQGTSARAPEGGENKMDTVFPASQA
jgi:hypothetical protein